MSKIVIKGMKEKQNVHIVRKHSIEDLCSTDISIRCITQHPASSVKNVQGNFQEKNKLNTHKWKPKPS